MSVSEPVFCNIKFRSHHIKELSGASIETGIRDASRTKIAEWSSAVKSGRLSSEVLSWQYCFLLTDFLRWVQLHGPSLVRKAFQGSKSLTLYTHSIRYKMWTVRHLIASLFSFKCIIIIVHSMVHSSWIATNCRHYNQNRCVVQVNEGLLFICIDIHSKVMKFVDTGIYFSTRTWGCNPHRLKARRPPTGNIHLQGNRRARLRTCKASWIFGKPASVWRSQAYQSGTHKSNFWSLARFLASIISTSAPWFRMAVAMCQ